LHPSKHINWCLVCERERDTEREREKERERKRDRETERQRDRERKREKERGLTEDTPAVIIDYLRECVNHY